MDLFWHGLNFLAGQSEMAKNQEIEARFSSERYRFGECLIGSARICSSSIEAAKAAGVSASMIRR